MTLRSENIGRKGSKRIVVKIGTRVLTTTSENGNGSKLDMEQMENIVAQVSEALNMGGNKNEVLIVSSGAIGAGMGERRMAKRPTNLPELQALAAIGQSQLMHTYNILFGKRGNTTAQLLLTRDDFNDERRLNNMRNTFSTLFEYGTIPIVNENDTIAVEEIKFGDNDMLSALVAKQVQADILIILSSTDGLLTQDPTTTSGQGVGERIREVAKITPEIEAYAGDGKTDIGCGGMKTKIDSCKIASTAGISVVIANGRLPDVILKVLRGEDVGTFFAPQQQELQTNGHHKTTQESNNLKVEQVNTEVKALARSAKLASHKLASIPTAVKNKALVEAANALVSNCEEILQANIKDIEFAKSHNKDSAMIDRLRLDAKRVNDMANAMRQVANLEDPVGDLCEQPFVSDLGLSISRVRVPLGVVFIIYEARPNVTADAAGLCMKSGNACILRGGKEAYHSNVAIGRIVQHAFSCCGIPDNCVQVVSNMDYEVVTQLLQCDDDINLVIPRGGESLIRAVTAQSRIPVIKHYKGVCHTYVDKDVQDMDLATRIVVNAKAQRPSTCNATETLLVHRDIASQFIPRVVLELHKSGVEVRATQEVLQLLHQNKDVGDKLVLAREDDFGREFLSLIIAVSLVNSLDDATQHIYKHGSGHTEAIITDNKETADRFLREVDSSAVILNASTRLNDGGVLGLGAEIGISTDKIHARGPMGLRELTSYKYVVRGDGQLRS